MESEDSRSLMLILDPTICFQTMDGNAKGRQSCTCVRELVDVRVVVDSNVEFLAGVVHVILPLCFPGVPRCWRAVSRFKKLL